MTEKMQKAIDKIDKESEKNPAYKRFAQYIIDNLIVSDSSSGNILDEKKTLKGCYESVSGKARKSAVGGCACIDDETVYLWIREYFGFTEIPVSAQAEKSMINDIVDFDIFADL